MTKSDVEDEINVSILYSPSMSTHEEDDMDWAYNLIGAEKLLDEGELGGLQQPDQGLGQESDNGSGGQQPPEGLAILPPSTPPAGQGNDQQPIEGLAVVDHGGPQPHDGEGLLVNVAGGEGQPLEGAVPPALPVLSELERLEAAKAEVAAGLGDKILTYEAILVANVNECKQELLLGGGVAAAPDLGSFISTGDGRLMATKLVLSMGQKKAWSYSFDPGNLKCMCVGSHNVWPLATARGESRGGPEVVILADQCCPPAFITSGGQRCVKVIRLEHGSLLHLVEGFIDILRGRYIMAGSVILLFSGTNMARAGTAGYIQDLMAAMAMLNRRVGEHLVVGPLPHIFAAGCGDAATIRTAVEVAAWCEKHLPSSRFMAKTSFLAANRLLEATSTGVTQPMVVQRMRLPCTGGGSATWTSTGLPALPASVRSPRELEEKGLVEVIINDIRGHMAIDLDPVPTFQRGVGSIQVKTEGSRYLVIGSSNAARLHKAMEDRRLAAKLVHLGFWRVLPGNVEALCKKLPEILEEFNPTTIVLQLLDNSLFYALQEDGSLIPARRLGDEYHMDGELVVGDKRTQQKVLDLCKLLFRSFAGRKLIVVTPLPRYVTSGCCLDKDHIPNRDKPGFLEEQLRDLDCFKKGLKDVLFSGGNRNARLMDPWVGLRDLDLGEVWGTDPVHPKPRCYNIMVDGVLITEAKIGGKRKASTDHGSASKSSRTGSSSYNNNSNSSSGGGGRGRGGGLGGRRSWIRR
jgi:hypothetical protein